MKLVQRVGDLETERGAPVTARNILVVTDEDADWQLARRLFSEQPLAGYRAARMRSRAAAFGALMSGEYAVGLVDARLDGTDGITLVREAVLAGCRTPLILLGAADDPGLDDAAISIGAVDCLILSQLDGRQLERALRYAVAESAARESLIRAQRGIAAVEHVGRVLASDGPTPDALSLVMDVLVERLGYSLTSIYLGDREVIELGAQRGYSQPIERIVASEGVAGRVMRTGRLAFVPVAEADPDFRAAVEGLAAEICAPLLVDGEFLGILNIESTADRPLDITDVKLVASIADRVAVAIALGRERRVITERAEMLARLNAFSATVGGTLEAGDLHQRIVDRVADVVACDTVVLIVRDEDDGTYRIRGMRNGDPQGLGIEIAPGDGFSGRAISERQLIVAPRLMPEEMASTVQDLEAQNPDRPEHYAALAVPLIHGDDVRGALSIWRFDSSNPFDETDQEGLILAAGQVALALANADLHAAVAELAIRDGLTGLHNRRYFDEVFGLLIAGRGRTPAQERQAMTAILFDLDEFGQLNKRHGHRTGDEVLRRFSRVLRQRFRASDLVARYGGEEFIVILDRASLADAERLANEVREALMAESDTAPDGTILVTTVSAGCAMLTETDSTGEALLAMADIGLTLAKRGGRNRVVAV
jgi:diguanylate cyclase (GGDEF)-like protein